MSAFCEVESSERLYDDFVPKPAASDKIDCCCFEWRKGLGTPGPDVWLTSTTELFARETDPSCGLRVLFLPTKSSSGSKRRIGFVRLIDHYSLPIAALSARPQNVTDSFGTCKTPDSGDLVTWSHFGYRDLATLEFRTEQNFKRPERERELDPAGTGPVGWIQGDSVVHVKYAPNDSSEAALVTLLCFSAPLGVSERFERLQSNAAWIDVLKEPYILFDIIYDELFQLLDSKAADLGEVFHQELEKPMLERTRHMVSDDTGYELARLHRLQKECILMIEAAEAAISTSTTIASILSQKSLSGPGRAPDPLTVSTEAAFEHRARTFRSTLLRLQSLEKRIANIISLSSNLVTQSGSVQTQVDSRSMKMIAFMALGSLAATLLASMYSTPIFAIDFSEAWWLIIAKFFRNFAITWPMTVVIMESWFHWRRLDKRDMRENERRQEERTLHAGVGYEAEREEAGVEAWRQGVRGFVARESPGITINEVTAQ